MCYMGNISLKLSYSTWGAEGFQGAIGKPLGRARRRETLGANAYDNVSCLVKRAAKLFSVIR